MAYKCVLLLACCLAFASARSLDYDGLYDSQDIETINVAPLIRHVRSPDGSVDLTYTQDQFGRTAAAQYNQHIYNTDNFKLDAYAQASRNFDYNRNDYGGGLRASYIF